MNLRISQNFVHSQKLAQQVIAIAGYTKSDKIIEIGPGRGIFTSEIAGIVTNLIAVEKDKDLAEDLKQRYETTPNVQVAVMDFLDFTLPRYDEYRIFGNIPFNLTSKMLQKIMTAQNAPKDSVLIMQKEAFERYIGKNLISLQYSPWFTFKLLYSFHREDFTPAPAVDSILCRITKKENADIDIKNKDEYLNFISFAYRFANPTLYSSLKKLFTDKQIGVIRKTLKKDIKQSPSVFDYDDWFALFDSFTNFVDYRKKMLVSGSFASLSREQSKISKVYRTRNVFNKW
jgi:23S rRNA (adenine-N6)-dimethyltransferase